MALHHVSMMGPVTSVFSEIRHRPIAAVQLTELIAPKPPMADEIAPAVGSLVIGTACPAVRAYCVELAYPNPTDDANSPT